MLFIPLGLLAASVALADLAPQQAAEMLHGQQAVVQAAIRLLPRSPNRAADLLSASARRLWRLGEAYPGVELVDETLRQAAASSSPDEMKRLAEIAAQQMANLEASLTQRGPQTARTDEAGRAITAVLARREFRQQAGESAFRRWIVSLLERFFSLLEPLFRALGHGGWLVIAVAVALCAVLLAVLVLFIARALPHLWPLFRRRKAAPQQAPEQGRDLGPAAAERALRRAREFADCGEWLEALRHVFQALLLRLDAAEIVDFREGETNWGYVRQVRAKAPAASPAMERATRLFEAKWYGQKSAGPEDYETALRLLGEAHGVMEAAHDPQ